MREDGILSLKLQIYTGKDLDEKLDNYCKEFLSKYVVFIPDDGEVRIIDIIPFLRLKLDYPTNSF